MDLVREELTKRHRLRVLDVGAGYGRALAELKEEFGSKVETHALVLTKTPELLETQKNHGGIDYIHQVAIETFLPKQEYDLIVSFFGGFTYAQNAHIAIEKIKHSLAVGGVAYIQLTSILDLLDHKNLLPKSDANFHIDTKSYYETIVIRRLR